MPEIHTISLFAPLEIDGGRIRISVISRPTLDDGKTINQRIREGITHHEWIKDFAPPAKLIGAYKRKEINWKAYESMYLEFLRNPEIREKIKLFAQRCAKEKITLACVEVMATYCHRRLLAEELQRHQSGLIIVHK